MAAPIATTSSGLTPLCGSLPKISLTSSCTFGTRVEPPTSTTSSISLGFSFASFRRLQHRLAAALDQLIDQLLELAAGDRHLQVLGHPLAIGRDERQVDVGRAGSELSSFLAFSQASCSRCRAIGSLRRSMPLLFLELVGDVVDQLLVEVVAAEVRVAVGADDLEDLVSSPSPPATSRTETSNVPPPRSKTTIFSSFFLSRP